MAVVLKAPVIFAFENNHYSEHTGATYAVGARDMASRAAGFGMAAHKVDGCDFFATYNLMAEVIAYCRAGKGPVAVELDTERFYGHFEGDPQRYRGSGEIERLRATRDCLKAFRKKALDEDLLDAGTLNAIDAEVLALIEAAVQEARTAPVPTAADVLEDVYVSY
jgi:TPP-dependent pyruvate/acetoin dehydrogenase alpha subunit